ncbi:hypothetical protein NLI96_g8494 [Meripilus lineatus]|uniref:HORMA domain-containing protein n=1 Tax=Meripilus lineatus TaxID=2056292 RepID=A0AAD5UX91_9APHY|nr:hypothetical protein NLI96_g8494 [Physisporinus lineatus]
MDALPKRRYATFKLFYYEQTPDDYEPPHFRAGDVEKDKWFFTTHNKAEAPEKCSIGQLQTGWHGVDVKVTSVSGYLPSTEDNDAPFLGITARNGQAVHPLTPLEEASVRAQQAEAQRQDAMQRRVVWDAEDCLVEMDLDGEGDRDDSGDSGQVLAAWRAGESGIELAGPVGMRDDNGNIAPLSDEPENGHQSIPAAETLDDSHYVGEQEHVPSHVGQLVGRRRSLETGLPILNLFQTTPVRQPENFEQTQQLDLAELMGQASSSPHLSETPSPSPPSSPLVTPKAGVSRLRPTETLFVPESLPPSDVVSSSLPSVSSYEETDMDTGAIKEFLDATKDSQGDEEMLNMETQVIPNTDERSLTYTRLRKSLLGSTVAPSVDGSTGDDEGALDCECGIAMEDCDCILCDGGCKRWFHVWCMGYHSSKHAEKTRFVCFDCRVRADENWDLIMVHDLHPRMMERFRDLALFRRAIKFFEEYNPPALAPFTKLMECEPLVSGQLFKRLESEGGSFSDHTQSSLTSSKGLFELKLKKWKTTPSCKQRKGRRDVVGPEDAPINEAPQDVGTALYRDYFTPTPDVEKRILKLADMKPKRKPSSRRNQATEEADLETHPLQPSSGTISTTNDERTDHVTSDPTEKSQENSQTQAETQPILCPQPQMNPVDHSGSRKRSSESVMNKTAKKVKISVGPAVDLGD